MSQAIHSDGDLRSFLVEHRESFEMLADHDDGDIAELLGEFPLKLINELPENNEREGDQ